MVRMLIFCLNYKSCKLKEDNVVIRIFILYRGNWFWFDFWMIFWIRQKILILDDIDFLMSRSSGIFFKSPVSKFELCSIVFLQLNFICEYFKSVHLKISQWLKKVQTWNWMELDFFFFYELLSPWCHLLSCNLWSGQVWSPCHSRRHSGWWVGLPGGPQERDRLSRFCYAASVCLSGSLASWPLLPPAPQLLCSDSETTQYCSRPPLLASPRRHCQFLCSRGCRSCVNGSLTVCCTVSYMWILALCCSRKESWFYISICVIIDSLGQLLILQKAHSTLPFCSMFPTLQKKITYIYN